MPGSAVPAPGAAAIPAVTAQPAASRSASLAPDRLQDKAGISADHSRPAVGLSLSAQTPAVPAPKKDDGWKIRFHGGFTRTHYFNSDVTMRTPYANIDVKDMKWKERHIAEAYNPNHWKQPMDALRWIDEPTNTFTLSATKNKNEFIFSAFHPKYLIDQEQVAHVKGEVGGVPVDGMMPLNENHEGEGGKPGHLHMTEVRNTHMQMDFQLGYGREFNLFQKGSSAIVYRPAVYAGVMMGKSAAKYEVSPGNVVEIEDQTRVHGATASIGNKLEYRYKDRVSLMAEHKLSGAMINQRLYGGTMSYNLLYSPLMVGVGVKLYDQDKHRK